MIFTNHLLKLEKLDKSVLEDFLILLNPFAPHISEELNEFMGNRINISDSKWPIWDNTLVSSEKITIVIQFNGKKRGTISIDKNFDKDQAIEKVKTNNKFDKYFFDKTIIKEIYIDKRLINFCLLYTSPSPRDS